MKSKNINFLFVLILGIAMLLSACAAGSDSDADDASTEAPAGDSTEAPEMTEAPTDATEAPAGDVVAAFDFNNKGDKDICELYLSPTAEENWGTDQLKGQTLSAGGKFTLTDIPAGYYDVKSVFCGGAGEEILPEVSISN